MTWNGALYYMDWKDYQTPVYDLAICPTTFNANLGNARIYGAESNIDYKVTEGLTVQVSELRRLAADLNTYRERQLRRGPGRTTAVRALLQLQRQCALRAVR